MITFKECLSAIGIIFIIYYVGFVCWYAFVMTKNAIQGRKKNSNGPHN